MNDRPLLRISPGDLEGLLGTLDVSFVALSECLVSMGYSLELGGMNAPGIHYNVSGWATHLEAKLSSGESVHDEDHA